MRMMGLSLLFAVLHRAVGSAVDQWAATAYQSIGVETLLSARLDLRGGGKLGSCPGASTTKGPPQKTVKILPKEK